MLLWMYLSSFRLTSDSFVLIFSLFLRKLNKHCLICKKKISEAKICFATPYFRVQFFASFFCICEEFLYCFFFLISKRNFLHLVESVYVNKKTNVNPRLEVDLYYKSILLEVGQNRIILPLYIYIPYSRYHMTLFNIRRT